jgi:hypothetical protein
MTHCIVQIVAFGSCLQADAHSLNVPPRVSHCSLEIPVHSLYVKLYDPLKLLHAAQFGVNSGFAGAGLFEHAVTRNSIETPKINSMLLFMMIHNILFQH